MLDPQLYSVIHRFALALGIGLLIGIEREREKSGGFAGIRTFPLLALGGTLTAMLNDRTGWSFVAGLIVVAAFIIRTYRPLDPASPGMTTEVAAMLAYILGGLCWWDLGGMAAALAAAIVLLLTSKQPLENIVRKLGHEEIMAASQLAVISLIVLPLVPDKTFGPLDVLNPKKIWLMVILVSGVNFACHLLKHLISSGSGVELAGLAGGLASSTAVTLSFAKQSRNAPLLAGSYGAGILWASIVMFARVAVVAGIIQPSVLKHLAIPLAVMVATSLIAGRLIKRRAAHTVVPQPDETARLIPEKNPLELWSAIQFGLLFAAVTFVAKAAHIYLGTHGIYASSAAAGLADVDAITVSLSDMASVLISPSVAGRGIITAVSVNTLAKMVITAAIGSVELRRRTAPALVMVAVAGLATAAIASLM